MMMPLPIGDSVPPTTRSSVSGVSTAIVWVCSASFRDEVFFMTDAWSNRDAAAAWAASRTCRRAAAAAVAGTPNRHAEPAGAAIECRADDLTEALKSL